MRAVAWSRSPPGAQVGSGQLTGRVVRGWVSSRTLGLLQKKDIKIINRVKKKNVPDILISDWLMQRS